MANINGNNMDDLFRQASDQYPLRTNSSDWDKLAAALESNPSLVSPQADKQDKRRRKRFLWLLLPLLAGGFGYFAWKGNSHDPAKIAVETNNTTANPNNIEAKAAPVPGDQGNGTAEKGDVGGDVKTGGIMDARRSIEDGRNADARRSIEAGRNADAKRSIEDGRSVETGKSLETGRSLQAGRNLQAGIRLEAGRNDKMEKEVEGEGIETGKNGETGRSIGTGRNENITVGTKGGSGDAQRSKVNGPGSMKTGEITIDAAVRATATGKIGKKTPIRLKSAHSIYVGLLGAPDLSTIQFQSIKSVGTTFGILGGYSFNSKWSLETGLYLDKKKYYTEGQYFSKKNVPALQYVTLQNVNGSCNMLEIPVNLRYNLSSGKNFKWFATAGLSTYLMSKEWYAYQYLYYGMPRDSAYTYRKPYQYLFSIVNLSIGYEQKLGRIGSLRIEPYLRIPLSGIGTGNLSIMSAGLNLGFVHRLW